MGKRVQLSLTGYKCRSLHPGAVEGPYIKVKR